MKAKYFTKIKKKAKLYDVEQTKLLFGSFDNFSYGSYYITVLAYNPSHACKRAVKRGFGREHADMYNVTTQTWARFAVKLHDKSHHWKNIVYLGN